MVRRRSRALAAWDIAPTVCPPTRTCPLLGSSRVPAMVSRVLLPEPLGPMTATISPWPTDRLTSCSAFTDALPSPYDLDMSRSSSRLIVVFSLPAGAVAAALVSDPAGPAATLTRPSPADPLQWPRYAVTSKTQGAFLV